MITKTYTTKSGISYWTTTGDDADNLLTGSTSTEGTYRDMLIGGAGDDILRGGGGSDTLDGGDGQDKLYGGSGWNSLTGGAGNDILDGSGGNDTVNGGAGNDVIAGGDDNDLLIQQDWFGTDRFDGGRGTDTLDYSGAATDGAALPDASVHVSLATGTVVKYLDGVESATDTIRNVDLFIVTAFNDTLDGNSGANMLEGRLGNDVLNGGDGNDTLNGDFGANFLSLNDTVGGDDTLNGGTGNDSLFGGAGNDRFVQDSAFGGDKIDGGVGSDTVDYSQLDSAGIVANLATGKVFKYANGYQRGIDTLHNIETLIATDFNDTLTGSGANDLIAGGSGDDHLVTSITAGNDTLDGGSGTDTLDYSAASGGNGRLAIDLAGGTITKYLGDTVVGTDTIRNIEAVVATGNNDTITGSDQGDVLDGGAGNDVLNGGAGAGSVQGGDGDDTILKTDSGSFFYQIMDGGRGIDTLDYSHLADPSLSITAFLDIEVFFIRGSSKYSYNSPIGFDLVDNFEVLIGTRNDDKIWGTDHSETLYGGAGNDTIHGESGDNYLVGGDGDDLIDEWSIDGNETMDGGRGIDTVDYSQFDYSHDRHRVEVDLAAGTAKQYYGNHILGGTDLLRNIEIVIGNAGDDLLTGGENDDDLRGGYGADTLNGASGNDKLSGDDGNDLILQKDHIGNDTIDGGAGADWLDYSQSAVNGSSIAIDWIQGTVSKYFGNILFGVDHFQNIETIIDLAHHAVTHPTTQALVPANVEVLAPGEVTTVGIAAVPVLS